MRRLFFLPILAPVLAFPQNIATDLVNPFIGTGGHGHTFPGACVPFGMVQLSPDTRTDGYNDWDACGGYHYSDSLIYGFSHTHLSGTGIPDLCDVLLMPMTERYSVKPAEYRSHFKHVNEEAHAGYYHVRLDDPGVDAELTTTERAGMHRYHFPAGKEAYVVLDLLHRDQLITGSIDPRKPTEVVGERRSRSWAGDQRLFYCIRFSRQMEDYVMSDKGTDRMLGRIDRPDTAYRAVFFFGDTGGEPLVIKVGISAVSIEGARRNLDAEMPGWDFDAVRKQAEQKWEASLGRIQVKGGTREEQRIFYTALYHSLLVPYIFNDVDRQYRGMDGEVHQADHDVYTVFSLWDTFRAEHPLFAILEPDRTVDFIKTFLDMYRDGGRLPVWELWGNETDCMIGYHSVSVIADAYMKGIRGFDADLALEAMVSSAMGYDVCLNALRKQGYIGSEDCPESVSKTLEYAYDDWCIEQMAVAMRSLPSLDKHTADRLDSIASVFHERSLNWQNLLDPTTKFFRARRNGGFAKPFDPFEVNFNYTEANAWQYSLFVPQDINDLADLVGGTDSLTTRIDLLFNASSVMHGRDQSDITGMIGQYAHGNEPSHHMAYLYDHVDHPEKTRDLVHRILTDLYHDTPDGLSGNEDCGQMSAWYVMSALGFYPTTPGTARYDLGYPLFDEASIHLPNGQTFSVVLDKDGKRAPVKPDHSERYATWTRTSISHEEILKGGELVLNSERIPYPEYYLPSTTVLSGAYIRECALPIIDAESRAFRDSLQVSISSLRSYATFQYAIDGSPLRDYTGPFWVHASCEVTAACGDEKVTAHFTRIDGDRHLKLGSTYSNEYTAGGDQALIDGIRGGKDFRTGEWQGFRAQDVIATVDLGATRKLKRAGLSVLQDVGSWIWYPSEVEVACSVDGKRWSRSIITHTTPREQYGRWITEFWTGPIDKKARYIRITAKNAGVCPDWHYGKGGTTWIFADEILIDAE